MSAGRDDTRDGLDIDGAKVGQGVAMLGKGEIEVMQRDAGLEAHEAGSVVDVEFEHLGEVIQVDEPGRGTGQVRRRMSEPRDAQPFSASPREGDNLLQLRNRERLEVQFRTGEEGLGPGVMQIAGFGVERDGIRQP